MYSPASEIAQYVLEKCAGVKVGMFEVWKAKKLVHGYDMSKKIPEGYESYLKGAPRQQLMDILDGKGSLRHKTKRVSKLLTNVRADRGDTMAYKAPK